jgi:hypothetical protein
MRGEGGAGEEEEHVQEESQRRAPADAVVGGAREYDYEAAGAGLARDDGEGNLRKGGVDDAGVHAGEEADVGEDEGVVVAREEHAPRALEVEAAEEEAAERGRRVRGHERRRFSML